MHSTLGDRWGWCFSTTVTALFCFFAVGPAIAQPARGSVDRSWIDPELQLDLLGWAARLSDRAIPPTDARPLLQAMPDDELARAVCPGWPQGCRGIVAAYDTDRQRIVYRSSLDMREPTDQSFIVHELVHWLQHLSQGVKLEESCESVLVAEREAYDVQNRYLVRFKQWQRVGDVLRFTFCNPAAARTSEPTVRFDASTGPITATHASPMASQPAR